MVRPPISPSLLGAAGSRAVPSSGGLQRDRAAGSTTVTSSSGHEQWRGDRIQGRPLLQRPRARRGGEQRPATSSGWGGERHPTDGLVSGVRGLQQMGRRAASGSWIRGCLLLRQPLAHQGGEQHPAASNVTGWLPDSAGAAPSPDGLQRNGASSGVRRPDPG